MPDKEIISILLQLIQSIQYDSVGESSMAQHLLNRSKRNKQIAIFFFWYLRTESESIHQKESKNVKNILQEKIQIYKNIYYEFEKNFK